METEMEIMCSSTRIFGAEERDEIRVRCSPARLHISNNVDLFATCG